MQHKEKLNTHKILLNDCRLDKFHSIENNQYTSNPFALT